MDRDARVPFDADLSCIETRIARILDDDLNHKILLMSNGRRYKINIHRIPVDELNSLKLISCYWRVGERDGVKYVYDYIKYV